MGDTAQELEVAAAMIEMLGQWVAQREALSEVEAWRQRQNLPRMDLDCDAGQEGQNAITMTLWAASTMKRAAARLTAAEAMQAAKKTARSCT